MTTKFTQKDYILIPRYYDRVLVFFKEEVKRIKKSSKKTLWYYGAKKTLEHLKEEMGRNLVPRDVDNIIYVLLDQIKEKQKKENNKSLNR